MIIIIIHVCILCGTTARVEMFLPIIKDTNEDPAWWCYPSSNFNIYATFVYDLLEKYKINVVDDIDKALQSQVTPKHGGKKKELEREVRKLQKELEKKDEVT